MNLFIAGTEQRIHRLGTMIANNPCMLSSYYHLTGGKHKMEPTFAADLERTKKSNGIHIMDSGLFTMMFGARSDRKYSEKELLDYTHRYLENMNNISFAHNIVEMDVHKVLGLSSLAKFRKIFSDQFPLERTIFVWHIEADIKGWKDMCKIYPYVALSVPELRIVMQRKYLKSFIQKMIAEALTINPEIKIHLLGCTSYELLQQTGYYSADSTSWQGALRWGSLTVPHTKDEILPQHLDPLIEQLQPKIDTNWQILQTKYGIQKDQSIAATKRIASDAISIATFRHMAETLNRDYFDKIYPPFDPEMITLLEESK